MSRLSESPASGGWQHPWHNYEPVFKEIAASRQLDANSHSIEMQTLYAELHSIALRTASAFLVAGNPKNRGYTAEEAVQDWHVVLLAGLFDRCDGRPMHMYAYGALRNVCMSGSRRSRRMKGLQDDYDVVDPRFNPLRALIRKEGVERIRQAIQSLPANLRDAIDAQFGHGLTAEQAAAKAGISAKGMESRRYRGRWLLIEKLKKYREEDL